MRHLRWAKNPLIGAVKDGKVVIRSLGELLTVTPNPDETPKELYAKIKTALSGQPVYKTKEIIEALK